jgi:hypothetical protein
MKECAAQVDKITQRSGLRSDKTHLSTQNHYSPQFGRCYAKDTEINPGAKADPKLLPQTYYVLWDAFEEKQLATCTDGPVSGNGMFCNIDEAPGSGFVDCGMCRSYIEERMTK